MALMPHDLSGSRHDPDESDYKPRVGPAERAVAVAGFHLVERALLVVVALLTIGGAVSEVVEIASAWRITLADILLMFLYTEVIGMVAVFYTGRGSVFVYPIFIATTALARLIVLQSKSMAPENIVFEAGAILLLATASVIIGRASRA